MNRPTFPPAANDPDPYGAREAHRQLDEQGTAGSPATDIALTFQGRVLHWRINDPAVAVELVQSLLQALGPAQEGPGAAKQWGRRVGYGDPNDLDRTNVLLETGNVLPTHDEEEARTETQRSIDRAEGKGLPAEPYEVLARHILFGPWRPPQDIPDGAASKVIVEVW